MAKSKQPTAKEKIYSILQENKGKAVKTIIKNTNLIDLIKRDITSYNDRITKNQTNQSKLSYANAIKELKENPTKKTLNKILIQTGKGYIKQPPKETLTFDKMTPKQQKKYLEKMQKKMELEAEKKLKKAREKGYQKYYKNKYGKTLKVKEIREIGEIFRLARTNKLVPHLLSSSQIVELNERKDFNEISDFFDSIEDINDFETANRINEIFGSVIIEVEALEVNEDSSDQLPIIEEDAIFGGM